MFRRPTLRTRKRAQRLTFHDAPISMGSGALDEPAQSDWQSAKAKARASAMSPDPNWVSPPSLKATKTKDVTFTVPFDWNQARIVEYLGELARQGAAQFERLPHIVPQGFKEVSFGEDEIIPMQSHVEPADERRVARDQAATQGTVAPMPDDTAKSTTTLGGTAGPGMMSDPVASYPTADKRFGYWIVTKPDSINVIRRDFGANGFSEVVGRFPIIEDSYYWFDVHPDSWNLYRTSKAQIDLGDRPGLRAGRETASVVGDRARRIASINAANRAQWARK